MSTPPPKDTDEYCPLITPAVDVAALSDRGKVRTNNEDSFHVVRFGRAMQTLFSNLPPGCVPDLS
jgi:hypothetical protein